MKKDAPLLDRFANRYCLDLIEKAVSCFVEDNYDRLEVSSRVVQQPESASLESFRVEFTTNVKTYGDLISFDAAVSAEIELCETVRGDDKSDSITQWFRVPIQIRFEEEVVVKRVYDSTISDGGGVEIYERGSKNRSSIGATNNLVPVIYGEDYDGEATCFLKKYCPEPLYNADAITKTKGAVFIVESPICALSIMQCRGAAIATCGTSGIHKAAAEIKAKKPSGIFVLSLDNDDAGQKAQQELASALFEANVKFITYNVAGSYKDPNELLMADAKALAANIKDATDRVIKQYSRLKKLFSASELQARDIKPIRWIVQELLPEGLSLICAPSKYGKSWLMMQLCIAVSQGKPFFDRKTEQCDCVYFSLEDSERRFKSRLNKLLNGEKAPSNFYGSVVSDNMSNGLFEQLTELIETHPKTGLIIIDTFQKVRVGAARNESVYGADYREMSEMKSFADKHGICVLLVHHVRKQIDDADVFNMINGSMAIMGAADTAWIMTRKKRDDANTTLKLTGRDVENNDLIISFDKHTTTWNLVGNAEDEAVRAARAEYEGNPIIKTVKALVEKQPIGWRGTSSGIKVKIYEETGALYTKSPETIGRTIRNYADRLLSDGITHADERGKRHLFAKKQPKLF